MIDLSILVDSISAVWKLPLLFPDDISILICANRSKEMSKIICPQKAELIKLDKILYI